MAHDLHRAVDLLTGRRAWSGCGGFSLPLPTASQSVLRCGTTPSFYRETSKFAGKIDRKAGTTVEVLGMRQGRSSQQQLRSLRLHLFQRRKVCGIAHQQPFRNNNKKGTHRNHAASHQIGTHHCELDMSPTRLAWICTRHRRGQPPEPHAGSPLHSRPSATTHAAALFISEHFNRS